MEKKLTEIVYLMDRSASMAGLERDMIETYHDFLRSLDTYDANTLVTVVLFDEACEYLYVGERASYARISPRQYYVRGKTALFDAIGTTIAETGRRVGMMPNLRPRQVLFVIATDGKDTASEIGTRKKTKRLIRRQEQEAGWNFLFIYADAEAFVTERRADAARPPVRERGYGPGGMRRALEKLLAFLGFEWEPE